MTAAKAAIACLTLLSLLAGPARAAGADVAARPGSDPRADFQPDPKAVRRFGAGYRYPQAGWIVLHIEGEPYDRGVQHGTLLATEIAGHIRCFAANQSNKAPTEGWKITRTMVNALFLRKFDNEYLREMQGIADGAAAAGAKFDDRPVDLLDIVTLNMWAELSSLDYALSATPTGLEGIKFPKPGAKPAPPAQPNHCSAFAATGPATADGKIVFGHITMFDLYPGNFYNVWLDIKPAKGHRILMQSYPGGIQSGMDYYMNSAGLLVCETTLDQTRFDAAGVPVASRIRKAVQYSDSIDGLVDELKAAGNGLYTNEWLIGDTKTNEIAMFELGTKASRLYRSSKNEWVGGTEGFYWGCNNMKDRTVRLETIAAGDDRPSNLVARPTDRDITWVALYRKHKGKIGADFAREALSTPPLAGSGSLDAKFTTADLAKDLKSWAVWGPPNGRLWQPTPEEKSKFPEIRPAVTHPWTILHGAAPAPGPDNSGAVDLSDKPGDADAGDPPTVPAWRGTLLAATDADIWLAAAFADYEKVVAGEKAVCAACKDGPLCCADRDKLAPSLFAYRSDYFTGVRAGGDRPLTQAKFDHAADSWYRVAAGKGVLLLHELRRVVGEDSFAEMMDAFGRSHAGKEVTTAAFITHCERHCGKKLDGFFKYWLEGTGLPRLKLVEADCKFADAKADLADPKKKSFAVTGKLSAEGLLPPAVEVTVEFEGGEKTASVPVDPATGAFKVPCDDKPLRLIVDKYGNVAKANGGTFSIPSFYDEIDKCLIVVGTADDAVGNRDAAKELQQNIAYIWANIQVPIRTDKAVTEEELKGHHLLLVGRPGTNSVADRLRGAFPVAFGTQSFTARGDTYAHPASAVVATAANPLNPRYGVLLAGGLSAASTFRVAPQVFSPMSYGRKTNPPAEVVVLENNTGRLRPLVIPAPELVREFK